MHKKHLKGSTLVEMMIYLALFVVVSFLVYQFFNFLISGKKFINVTSLNTKVLKETEEKLSEIIQASDNITVDKVNNKISVTIHGCTNTCDIVYDDLVMKCFKMTGVCSKDCATMVMPECVTLWNSQVVVSQLAMDYTLDNNIYLDNYYHWAWSDKVGWLDWTNVVLDKNTNQLTGFANFINGFDKISMNCLTSNTCSTSNYKVSLSSDGQLHGYAWGDYTGWISFNCKEGGDNQVDICSTSNYNTTINANTGDWDGYAWSENIGWISFNCITGGQSANNVCSTSNYKVRDSRTTNGIASIGFKLKESNNKVSDVKWNFSYDAQRKITVTSITPNTGVETNDNLTISSIVGVGFQSGATVKLVKAGVLDIYPSTLFSFVSSIQLANGVFNLNNRTLGVYDVVVINPDGSNGVLKNGFTITAQ